MKLMFVACLLFSSMAFAEDKKCSPENLETLAKGYKKIFTADFKDGVSELKALVALEKQSDKYTSKEIMKKVFVVKKDSRVAITEQKDLMAKIEKLEANHPECFFK